MRSRWFPIIAALLAPAGFAQTFDVGAGAPTSAITQSFVDAWLRNGFAGTVGPPLANVATYGPTGLIQEYPSTLVTGQILALIAPNTTGTVRVWQVSGPMFAYYTTVTVGTAGYPTYDTQTCPLVNTNSQTTCTYQTFSNNYVLFVYTAKVLALSPLTMATRDPFYTKWVAEGGVGVFGPAIAPEVNVTTRTGETATLQQFDNGTIYSITGGILKGRVLAIPQAVWNVYNLNGADQGYLGLPVTDLLQLPNGLYQQSFEGGAIQYDATTGLAQLRPPIYMITLAPTGSAHLNAGDTLSVKATVITGAGVVLTDRVLGWNTSNSQVVQIQSSGGSATLKAAAAGTAIVTASAEGKTSAPLTITVSAPCCTIGEGAPTQALQKAFQDAVTKAGLTAQLPAATPAIRAGTGYAQQVMSSGSAAAPFLIALQDGSLTAYIVTGGILTQYLVLGGPAGALGFPTANATAGGRQSFQQGTLAGSPVQQVSGAILAKWASLGYEIGTAGSPTAAATPFQTFRGTTGVGQTFQNALIVADSAGSIAGQSFWISGSVLAQYNANGGPAGNLGSPTNDEHNAGALRWQDFEGGYITYTPGSSAAANLTVNPRQPVISVSPATVISGGTVHVIAAGFKNGAAVRVSQTGQPDFQVTIPAGAYTWDVWVPPSAASGTITISATDPASNVSAQATYAVRNVASSALTVSIASGDQQTGAPGALLPQPLVVIVKDSSGNPAAGQTVTFAASPGGTVTPVTAVTGSDGKAGTVLRMPPGAGVGLATAVVSRQVATFSARSAPFALSNFTTLSQNVSGNIGSGTDPIAQKGALLTAAASILRYYQSAGSLPAPNGLADPIGLNQFLTSFCAAGTKLCDGYVTLGVNSDQTANLWRLGGFAANDVDVSVESLDMNSLRDLIAGGSPILLALSLNGQGSHFVAATGISPAGDLVIADPNPVFAQTLLGAYLAGFTSTAGDAIQGTLTGAARLLPRPPSPNGFVVAATAPVAISSVNGPCGATLQFPDTAASSGVTPKNPPGSLYFSGCAGADQGPYQLDVNSAGAFTGTFTTLSSTNGSAAAVSGAAASSSLVVRSGTQWTLAPLAMSIAASGVVNAASFSAQIAPGGYVSIFGAGFTPASGPTFAAQVVSIQVNGETAPVLATFPFQINAQIPADIPPGSATLTVTGGARLGSTGNSAQQLIAVSQTAPAIFSIGQGQAAITNQDNSLNTPSNPAFRGQAIVVYGTGFGAVTPSGKLNPTSIPVTAVIGATETATAFAGLTPGFIGLYQANVVVPASLPPGLALPLYLKQGGASSNTVNVAVE